MRKLILAAVVMVLACFGLAPAAMASTQAPRASVTTVRWVFADGLCADSGNWMVRAMPCTIHNAAQAWGGVDTIFGNRLELIPAAGTRYCVRENHSYNWAQVSLTTACNSSTDRSATWYIIPRLGGYELQNGWSGLCLQDGYNEVRVTLTVHSCNGSSSQEISPFSLGTPI